LALCGGALLSLILGLIQPFYTVNLITLSFNDLFYTSGTASPNIVIAGIDDETMAAYGKFSEWPRRLHAQAIENLKKAGATVIGYDVIFTDASQEDDILAKALASAGNVVLAAAGQAPLLMAKHSLFTTAFLSRRKRWPGHAPAPGM